MQKSKTALLELRDEYDIALGGEEILEQKRNIILREIMTLLDEVDEKRKRVDELVQKSYRQLIKAFMESGEERIELESRLVRPEGSIEVISRSFIGVVVPEVHFRRKEKDIPLNYMSNALYLDIARVSFSKTLKLILELSSVEIKIWRLAEELKKTIVRVNALKNYYLPKYRSEIRQIEASLEESEREFLSVLKRLRE